ncbi:lysis protein [Providencia rettgeri]|uniref:Lysis protein n=1 Tax=Providencia rettgeri TaxID=587 RepID=A0AAP2K2H7_PRORE|nr:MULTISPECIES: lysis protein [Providencia]APC12891.1 Bacteriophage lysis protein [Providencia rettgeri]MBX6950266.1 lysis protein [Providencia rettgeri]MBX6957996.1 lysis protein [Providencia rettgeri]MBX6962460.1 lysis protein [Providencia rettgeri]MBX6973803.1 lysis protein [Providencia rettgeri]
MGSLTKVFGSVCAILAFWLWWVMGSYSDLKGDYSLLKNKFNEQVAITADYEKRINSLHELDTKHTTELTNAKAEIDQLRIAAERNPERVYIRASCQKVETNSTSSLDDAVTARPTDSAIGNYWILRQRITESKQMILGLQDYIRTECSQ